MSLAEEIETKLKERLLSEQRQCNCGRNNCSTKLRNGNILECLLMIHEEMSKFKN